MRRLEFLRRRFLKIIFFASKNCSCGKRRTQSVVSQRCRVSVVWRCPAGLPPQPQQPLLHPGSEGGLQRFEGESDAKEAAKTGRRVLLITDDGLMPRAQQHHRRKLQLVVQVDADDFLGDDDVPGCHFELVGSDFDNCKLCCCGDLVRSVHSPDNSELVLASTPMPRCWMV